MAGRKPRDEYRKIDDKRRRTGFEEVYVGFTEEEAQEEASRCLNCRVPMCRKGCPANVDIPGFIQLILQKKYKEAYDLIRSFNYAPAVCSRCCPQEKQCEGNCVLGKKLQPVHIGALERFVADQVFKNHREDRITAKTDKRVAIVGCGPAGMSAAYHLLKKGIPVTVYEKEDYCGGLLYDGIPTYRLPDDIVRKLVDILKEMGAEIKNNVHVGKDITINDLREQYNAIFIAAGEAEAYSMGIEGEDLKGVYLAKPFLRQVNLWADGKIHEKPEIGDTVVVVGGGNVAMDSVRCAVRLGARKVILVYRRSEMEMPATREELELAKDEGVEFMYLTNPKRILGRDGRVTAVECLRMRLGEPDRSGRRRPIPVEGSEFTIDTDTVIMAIGQSPDCLLYTSPSPRDLSTSRMPSSA